MTLTFPVQGHLIFLHYVTCKQTFAFKFVLSGSSQIFLPLRDLNFKHSNFKVIQYLRLTIAFKLVLSHSSQILLPLCNPAIPSLAVSCFNTQCDCVIRNILKYNNFLCLMPQTFVTCG